MQVSGKLITIGIFGLGLVAAIAAFFVQYNSRRQIRDFWGPDTAVLISRAPKVELLRLKDGVEAGKIGEQLMIDGVAYQIAERQDISKARGFVHVRDALIRDAGFEWGKARGDCEANWEFAFRFVEDNNTADVVFDFACERVRLLSGGQEACISPIFEGIKESVLREYGKCRYFWGPDTTVLISRAPKVELLRLTKAAETRDDGSQLAIDDVTYEISERKDISKARGFVHVRDALIRDAGFEWDKARGDCVPQWDFVLAFEEGEDRAIVALDLNCERVQLVPGGQEASIGPTAGGIKKWLDEEFPEMMKNKKRDEELRDS